MTWRRTVACAAIAMVSTVVGPPSLRLQVVGAESGTWSVPIRVGERFDISFVHSQEKTTWTQHYRVGRDLRIEQTGSTFGSYGAGMPTGPTTRSRHGFRAETDRRFGAIYMLHARDARLTLHYRQRAYAIDRWFVPFEHFAIRVR